MQILYEGIKGTKEIIIPILNLCQPIIATEEVKVTIWTEKVPMSLVTH